MIALVHLSFRLITLKNLTDAEFKLQLQGETGLVWSNMQYFKAYKCSFDKRKNPSQSESLQTFP
jgi:hypothetical protein